MNTRQTRRASNMAYLKQFMIAGINKHGEIDYDRTVAFLVVTLNLSQRTAKEMVDSYLLYGDFELLGNVITYTKRAEKANPIISVKESHDILDAILSAQADNSDEKSKIIKKGEGRTASEISNALAVLPDTPKFDEVRHE